MGHIIMNPAADTPKAIPTARDPWWRYSCMYGSRQGSSIKPVKLTRKMARPVRNTVRIDKTLI